MKQSKAVFMVVSAGLLLSLSACGTGDGSSKTASSKQPASSEQLR